MNVRSAQEVVRVPALALVLLARDLLEVKAIAWKKFKKQF
jgi:hypothetical protein